MASDSRQPVRLGSVAPNFDAKTTHGPINLHKYIETGTIGNKEGNGEAQWLILFSHPADFTPVCTTELGEVAKLSEEFKKRKVRVLGLSANSLEDHEKWVSDINEVNHTTVNFPIIADDDRKISYL